MNEEKDDIQKEEENKPEKKVSQGRRDALKAMISVPVLGAMAYGVYEKKIGAYKTECCRDFSF